MPRKYTSFQSETLSDGATVQRFDGPGGTRFTAKTPNGETKSFYRRQEAIDWLLSVPPVVPIRGFVEPTLRYRTFDNQKIAANSPREVVSALRAMDYGRPPTDAAYRETMAQRVRTHFASEVDPTTNVTFVKGLAIVKLLRVVG